MVYYLHTAFFTARKPFTHLLAVCIQVNTTCMVKSWLSQLCEISRVAVIQLVFCHIFICVFPTSHHYEIVTDLDCTVVASMPDYEWAWLGSRPVHRDPLSGVRLRSSDEENSVLPCCTAVGFPAGYCVLQMRPRPVLVNLTGGIIAGN